MAQPPDDKPTRIASPAPVTPNPQPVSAAPVRPVPIQPAPPRPPASAFEPTKIASPMAKPPSPPPPSAPAGPAPASALEPPPTPQPPPTPAPAQPPASPMPDQPSSDAAPTRVLGGFAPTPAPAQPTPQPHAPAPSATHAPAAAMQPKPNPEQHGPVVGWLVVTEGPGRGRSIELGYGINRVGRGNDQRVVLDFGDDGISRDRAAEIAYDPKTRRFTLLRGNSANLIYLNNDAVYQPTDMKDGDEVQISQTTLRFVGLCGEGFSWDDVKS